MTGEVRPWYADDRGVKWAGDVKAVPPNGEPVGELFQLEAHANAPATTTYAVVVDGIATTLQLSDVDARRMGLLSGEDAP